MLLGYMILLYSQPALWVLILVASIEVAVMIYIVSKPSTPPVSI
jgi:hypothetical protein